MSPSAALVLIRPRSGSTTITLLQVAASGITTVLAFASTTLALAFWRVPSDEIGYRVLAIGLVGVLLVPLVTLGTATARLAARSRDDRLATLRLLGASAASVRRIAVTETTLLSACGVLMGTALSLLLPFVLAPMRVFGEALRPAELWLPWWLAGSIPPTLVLAAALSALLGLRRVVLSPLGVRTRQDAPRLSRWRPVIALGVVAAAVVAVQAMSPGWGIVVIVGVLALVVVAVMAVLGLVGPFAVSLRARGLGSRTSDPAALVAARGISDDPRAAWRSVSALALATFILIPAGSLLGYLDAISRSASRSIMTPDQLRLFADARTILLALVAISFVVVACQIAITQTAGVLERRELYLALDRIGAPRTEVDRMRRASVMLPARIAVIGAAVAATAIAFPLVVTAAITAPLFAACMVVVLALGLALVRLGLGATGPVLRRTLARADRGE